MSNASDVSGVSGVKGTAGRGHSTIRTVTVLARCLMVTFVVMVVADRSTEVPSLAEFGPLLLGLAAVVVAGRLRRRGETGSTPVEVEPPVTGRWQALNSPATRVPSHHTRAYGQTYAIDLVAEPADAADGVRPPFRWAWPLVRRSSAYPAFGRPLLAVADATVVRVSDWRRDHMSRTSGPSMLYLFLVEALVRDLSGAGWLIGNHVVLDLGDGTHALYAHLQRGSATVRPGDRVSAGQPIARCGNSGNSTEPHLHFQLMDHPNPDAARGIPFSWRGMAVPANGQHVDVIPDPVSPVPPVPQVP
ncbi:M23 family metallopeptidase [Streptomyces sp. 4N509B]|uniref:M23 family metallopeptidase n=1 Tax=Streptomyces sp. 4N509B TaxID=3457413 RepID=UPI003FD0068D